MQVAARHVKGYVGRIDYPVQQGEELGDNALNRVGYVNLIAEELNLVLLYVEVRFDLRKVENTCQVERIIHVEVDIEQRILRGRV